jgi:hypothetical protein
MSERVATQLLAARPAKPLPGGEVPSAPPSIKMFLGILAFGETPADFRLVTYGFRAKNQLENSMVWRYY